MDENFDVRVDKKFASGYGRRGFRGLMTRYILGWVLIALLCGILEFLLFIYAAFYGLRYFWETTPLIESLHTIILLLIPVGLFAFLSFRRWNRYKSKGLSISTPFVLFLAGIMTVLFVIFVVLSAALTVTMIAVSALKHSSGGPS